MKNSVDIKYECPDEVFVLGKQDDQSLCEDVIVQTDGFFAVIDGVTSKSEKLYNNQKGGRYAAQILADAIGRLNGDEDAATALAYLDRAIAELCPPSPVDPSDRIQACAIIYSKRRKEIWNYGDCNLMINERRITHSKLIDEVLGGLRAFIIAVHLKQGGSCEELFRHDFARDAVLPYMKNQALFANADGPFGYPVIDGSGINLSLLKIYPVSAGDRVVLASDGYPLLFPTLAESEEYLGRILKDDPLSCNENIQTKMKDPKNASFDDRAYLRFTVK